MAIISQIWDITLKDLRQVAKDRGALLMLFVVPLLLIGVLGSVVSNAFSNSSNVTATLPVVTRDRGAASDALIAALRHVPSLHVQLIGDISAAKKQVRDGDRDGLLIIPAGFSAELRSAHPNARLTYYSVPDNTSTDAEVARASVQAVVQQFAFQAETEQTVSLAQQQATGKSNPTAARSLAVQAAARLDSSPPVAMRSVNATGRNVSPTQNTVPGYALMFALFGIMGAARTVLEEKESGTFKRLLIAPIPRFALLAGKLLAQFIQSMVQLTVLLAAGALLFKISLGSSLPALALLVIATSFAATGLGIVLMSVIKTERQVRPISMLIVLSFSALGGSWWSISLEPAWMQNLAKFTINGWAMQGFNGLMIFDKGFVQILPDIGALFLYGLVCLAIARRTFRFAET